MKYRQLAPIPSLQSAIECIWTLETEPGEAAGAIEPVLPDGCPELIVQFGERFDRVHADGSCERQADILFAGQLTGQLSLQPTGAVRTLGVRFGPGGAAAILRMPQQPLLGTTIGVDLLNAPLARELVEIKDGSRSLDDAAGKTQLWLSARLDARWLDRRVLAAVDMIRRHHGQVGIAGVASTVAMTRRHLERRFDALVGITPKHLARIVRFQRALRLLHVRPETPGLRRPASSGATTAIECGYADQPHFIREFRELSGCSPGAHLLRHAQLSGFFTGRADLSDPP